MKTVVKPGQGETKMRTEERNPFFPSFLPCTVPSVSCHSPDAILAAPSGPSSPL